MTLACGPYGPALVTKHTEKQSIPLEQVLRNKIYWIEDLMLELDFITSSFSSKFYGSEYYDE